MLLRQPMIAVIAACALAPSARADSLQAREDRAAEQKRADEDVAETNSQCKSSIKWTFDWSTWKLARDEAGHHASASCGLALYGIKSVCTDPAGQDAVAKQVKTIKCLGNAAEAASVDFKGGTLTIKTGLVETKGDITDLTKQALQSGLK